LDAANWKITTFLNLFDVLLDEIDLPHKSFSTAFKKGKMVDSLYKKLLAVNRCNKRDYQNLGVIFK